MQCHNGGNDGVFAVTVPNNRGHGCRKDTAWGAYRWYAVHGALSNSVVGQHDDEDVVVTPVVANN